MSEEVCRSPAEIKIFSKHSTHKNYKLEKKKKLIHTSGIFDML